MLKNYEDFNRMAEENMELYEKERIAEIVEKYTPGNTMFREVGACTLSDIMCLLGRLAAKNAEIQRLREEQQRMKKKMCFHCWFNSVRGKADTHECGDCEWKKEA